MTEEMTPPTGASAATAEIRPLKPATAPGVIDERIREAQNGNQRAFEALYRETVEAVYGLCLRMTANPALAEDCVQQTYLQAWRNLPGFRGNSALSTWLHRIAVNEVRGHFRKDSRHESNRADFDAAEESLAAPAPSAGAEIDLERAIAELPERGRAVFVLVGVYGYPHEEAATMLDMAVGTSKAHFHQARRRLQARLGSSNE